MAEAKRRGLSNLKTTVDALPELVSPKSKELFTRHQVFSEAELKSRYEILLEGYCKTLQIEALTMVDMVKKEIIPACIAYQNELAELLGRKKAWQLTFPGDYLLEPFQAVDCFAQKLTVLEHELLESKEKQELLSLRFCRSRVFTASWSYRSL